MARPTKPPWEISWKHYNESYHLVASFFDADHKLHRFRTQTSDYAIAIEMAAAKIKELKSTDSKHGQTITLGSAVKRITLEVWQYQKDFIRRNRVAKNMLLYFDQNFLLKDIQEDKINEWELHLREIGNSGATINRKMAVLKVILNRAYKNWRLLDRVPLFPNHKEKKGGHKRSVTPEELKVIVSNADYKHGLLFRLMYQTGMRLSECFKVTADQLDLDNKVLKLSDTKSGEDGIIPVPAEIFRELKDYLKDQPLEITPDSARYHWSVGRKILGLEDDFKFTPGALRHTFALQLIKEGYAAPVVQGFLRHSTIITTQSYFKQTQNDLLRIRDERS